MEGDNFPFRLDVVGPDKNYKLHDVFFTKTSAVIHSSYSLPDILGLKGSEVNCTTVFDPESYTLRRFVIPECGNDAIVHTVPNDTTSRLAVVVRRNSADRVLVFDFASSSPWSPVAVHSLQAEKALKLVWLSTDVFAVVTESTLIHHWAGIRVYKNNQAGFDQHDLRLEHKLSLRSVLHYQVSENSDFATIFAKDSSNRMQFYLVPLKEQTPTIYCRSDVKGAVFVNLNDELLLRMVVLHQRVWKLCTARLGHQSDRIDAIFKAEGCIVDSLTATDVIALSVDWDVTQAGEAALDAPIRLATDPLENAYYLVNPSEESVIQIRKLKQDSDEVALPDEVLDARCLDIIIGSVDQKVTVLEQQVAKKSKSNRWSVRSSRPLPTPVGITQPTAKKQQQTKANKDKNRFLPFIKAGKRSDKKYMDTLMSEFSHEKLTKHLKLQGKLPQENYFVQELFLSIHENRELEVEELFDDHLRIRLPRQSLESVPSEISESMKQAVESHETMNFVFTDRTKENVERLLLLINSNMPVFIEGEPATGKTFSVRYCAAISGAPLLRFTLSPHTSAADLLGSVRFAGSGSGSQFRFEPGIFTRAVRDGYWLLLDEANLASDAVLRVLEDVLDTGMLQIRDSLIAGQSDAENGCLCYRRHPNFRLFLCQNSNVVVFGFDSLRFSKSLMSHFVRLTFSKLPDDDVEKILKGRCSDGNTQMADKLISIYRKFKDKLHVTLRDLLHAQDIIINSKPEEVTNRLMCLFSRHSENTASQAEETHTLVQESLQMEFGPKQVSQNLSDLRIGEVAVLSTYSDTMEYLDLCHDTKRPGMLVGESFSGKFTAIWIWAKKRNIELEEYYCHSETSTDDLVGQFQPQDSGAVFQWVDGPVARAIKEGKCLVLRSINLVEKAVLESLNALLETGPERRYLIDGKMVPVDPSFFVLATFSQQRQNELFELPQSFLSRFVIFDVPENILSSDVESFIANRMSRNNARRILDLMFRHLPMREQDSTIKCKLIYASIGKIAQFVNGTNYLAKKPIALDGKNYSLYDWFQVVESIAELVLESSVECKHEWTQNVILDSPVYTLGESRQKLAGLLMVLLRMKIPVLLEGHSGVGKTSLVKLVSNHLGYAARPVIFLFNKDTVVTDLMGCYLPDGTKAKFKEGPLSKAMREGSIFIADELNLASPEVTSYLTPLLSGGSKFRCSIRQQWLDVHPEFAFVGTQNPTEYVGRQCLPEPVLARLVKYSVPDYTRDEIVDILYGKVACFADSMKQNKPSSEIKSLSGLYHGARSFMKNVAKNLFSSELSSSEMRTRIQELVKYLQGHHNQSNSTTLRTLLKLVRRLTITEDLSAENWLEKVKLHVAVLMDLFPPQAAVLDCKIECVENDWLFEIFFRDAAVSATVSVKLKALQKSLPQPMIRSEQLSLCKLALALHFAEPVVLEGRTNFKATMVRHLTQIVDFGAPELCRLTTLYMSDLTETRDLFGGIEPHSAESFEETCANPAAQLLMTRYPSKAKSFSKCTSYFESTCSKLRNRLTNELPAPFKQSPAVERWKSCKSSQFCDILKQHSADFIGCPQQCLLSDAAFAHETLQNLSLCSSGSQIFPFCERGIMRNIRFGGIAFLRDINLADQAVIECLNSVTELEPSFTHPHQFDAPIALSVNFRLIATISLPTDKDISPSMRSRYTVIHVRDPQLTDVSRGSEAEVFFRDILSRESSIPSSLSEDIDRGLSEALKLSNGILSVKSLVNMASFAKIPPKCCKSPFSLALKQEFPQSDSPNEILSEASLFSEQEFQRVSQNLTVTRRAKEVLSHLLIAHYTESVVNLVGPPGVGKTQITRIFAESVLKKKFIRISCSSDLSQEDLFGSFVPTAHSNSGTKATKMTFQFREGAILEQAAVADSARMAGRKPKSPDEYQGAVILFDEINLAPSNVLSTII
uniref:AAA_5 domain-containing protein n=2 Tax=Macrostomum lignano TaxID=282301 RepID=A0A1I8I014_9PLAT